jgi:hypothetical protein
MRREKNYGPGAVTPQGRIATDTAAAKRGSSAAMVRQGRAPGEHRKSAITMRVTYLPPSGHRQQHWGLGRCPVCGVPHLSRSRELDQVTKTRRLPCRHWVQPVIARSLSPYDRAVA